jgi:hypothetical protein
MTTPILIDPSAFKTYYLGVAGAMQQIRTPNAAVQQGIQRAEVLHQLISGGNAITRRRRGRRAWQLSWSGCTPDVADQMIGFYLGVFGDGPFMYVDPSWRNALSLDASTFGAQFDANTAWVASSASQSVTFDTTVTAPSPQSGVSRWAVAALNSQMSIGSWNGSVFVPDPVTAPPYLTPVVSALFVQARAVTGTPSVTLRGKVVDAAGTVLATANGTTATLSTSAWTPLTCTVPAGTSGAAYLLPNVICNTANSFLQFSCAQLQYGRSSPSPWVIGLGIPRVVAASGMGADYDLLYARDLVLTLAEV